MLLTGLKQTWTQKSILSLGSTLFSLNKVENPLDHCLMPKDPLNQEAYFRLEAVAAATVLTEEEKRPLTPFNDSSSDEDNDDNKPQYRDTFGSFGVQSSCTAHNKPPR